MLDNDNLSHGAVRLIGALAGVLISMIMVAPEGTKASLYRLIVGLVAGVIFAPAVGGITGLGFLEGSSIDMMLARAFTAGFSSWFVLEFVSRFARQSEWLEKVLKLVIEARTSKGGDQ